MGHCFRVAEEQVVTPTVLTGQRPGSKVPQGPQACPAPLECPDKAILGLKVIRAFLANPVFTVSQACPDYRASRARKGNRALRALVGLWARRGSEGPRACLAFQASLDCRANQ